MVPESYHEFFVAEAGAAAALIGLLFVAVSVAHDRIAGRGASLVAQTRAASALTCFVIPLSLALIGLLPRSHVGIFAIVFAAGGVLFVAATLRRYFSGRRGQRENLRGLAGLFGFTVVLLVILGFGIVALVKPDSPGAIDAIAASMIASTLLGIERAWALIGGRGTGRSSSVRDLVLGERDAESTTE